MRYRIRYIISQYKQEVVRQALILHKYVLSQIPGMVIAAVRIAVVRIVVQQMPQCQKIPTAHTIQVMMILIYYTIYRNIISIKKDRD